MTRRSLAVLGVATLLGVAVSPAAPASADGPLQQAGRAAEKVAFSGRVRVEWVDSTGPHASEMEVNSAQGEVEIQGRSMLVATAQERYAVGSDGWNLLGPGDPGALGTAPPVTRKYVVAQQPGPLILGRPTDQVDLSDAGRIDERLYVDQATGLLLTCEQFDTDGQQIRKVSFVRLVLGPAPGMPLPTHPAGSPARKIASGWVPPPYTAPPALGEGYQRVEILLAFNGIQVVYSDGLHGLSMFERPGRLASAALPAGGQPVTVGRWSAVRYGWPGGQVVMWKVRGSTYVVVGDAPAAEVLAALAPLPAPGVASVLDRVRRACRRLAEAVSGRW